MQKTPVEIHVMVDLETLSTHNDAAIVTLGAIAWEAAGGLAAYQKALLNPERQFHKGILTNQWGRDKAAHIEAKTVAWWLSQPGEAQARLLRQCSEESFAESSVYDVLVAFDLFLSDQIRTMLAASGEWDTAGINVWGNGATFDNVVLRSAYARCGMSPLWSFRNDRCYRTLVRTLDPQKKLAPPDNQHAHDALEDAKWQGLYLATVLDHLHGSDFGL